MIVIYLKRISDIPVFFIIALRFKIVRNIF